MIARLLSTIALTISITVSMPQAGLCQCVTDTVYSHVTDTMIPQPIEDISCVPCGDGRLCQRGLWVDFDSAAGYILVEVNDTSAWFRYQIWAGCDSVLFDTCGTIPCTVAPGIILCQYRKHHNWPAGVSLRMCTDADSVFITVKTGFVDRPLEGGYSCNLSAVRDLPNVGRLEPRYYLIDGRPAPSGHRGLVVIVWLSDGIPVSRKLAWME